jgi:hypothetical protein
MEGVLTSTRSISQYQHGSSQAASCSVQPMQQTKTMVVWRSHDKRAGPGQENNKLSGDQCVCKDQRKLIKGVTATFIGRKNQRENWIKFVTRTRRRAHHYQIIEGSDRAVCVRPVALPSTPRQGCLMLLLRVIIVYLSHKTICARMDGHRHSRYHGHGRGAVPIQNPATLSLNTRRNLYHHPSQRDVLNNFVFGLSKKN